MSLSSDLNLLAANNIIGYDTCAQTLNGMGIKRSGYNPYGVGKLNTGVTQDTFINSSNKGAAKRGIISGTFFALTTKILSEIGKETTKTTKRKRTTKKSNNILNKIFGKTTKKASRTAKTAAKKGFKGVLSKIGKFGKGALIVAGIGTVAAGALRYQQQASNSNRYLYENGQPVE